MLQLELLQDESLIQTKKAIMCRMALIFENGKSGIQNLAKPPTVKPVLVSKSPSDIVGIQCFIKIEFQQLSEKIL